MKDIQWHSTQGDEAIHWLPIAGVLSIGTSLMELAATLTDIIPSGKCGIRKRMLPPSTTRSCRGAKQYSNPEPSK